MQTLRPPGRRVQQRAPPAAQVHGCKWGKHRQSDWRGAGGIIDRRTAALERAGWDGQGTHPKNADDFTDFDLVPCVRQRSGKSRGKIRRIGGVGAERGSNERSVAVLGPLSLALSVSSINPHLTR